MTLEEVQAENTGLKAQVATLESAQERVNRESKSHRLNAEAFQRQAEDFRGQLDGVRQQLTEAQTNAQGELERLRIDLTGRATAAETAATEAAESAKQRVMMADLRIASREAGLLDPDALQLLDKTAVQLADDGSVTNAADLMAAMREAKPYLFGQAPKPGTVTGTTAPAAAPPRPAPAAGFDARTATREDYHARRAEMANSGPR